MALRKGCCLGGCLIKAIIGIVIMVLIIGGAAWWVSNQTLDRFGLGNVEIGGMTLEELGLADMKIKDIYAVLNGLFNVDEDDIVNNPFDSSIDGAGANEACTAAGLPEGEDGPDYLSLLENPVETEQQMLVELSDTEIAYIMNEMVNDGHEYAEEEVETVRDMNAGIAQVVITKDTDITLEVMLNIDISDMQNDLPDNLGFIPTDIYLNSINTLTVDQSGIVSTESQGLQINGMSDEMTDTIIAALYDNLSEEQDEEPEEFFNETMGTFFATVINNLGLVGDADANEFKEVTGNISYGEEGVSTHNIKVITREESGEA